MAYLPSSEILNRLNFYSVPTIPDDGRLLIWENRQVARRIVIAVGVGIIYFDRILPSGKNDEVSQAHRPTSDIEFEKQLQAINWL